MDLRRLYNAAGPVSQAFMSDRSFVAGIMGPFGSGKSTNCVMKILLHSGEMPKCKDGVKRARWAVIRNTYPELKTTTMTTWHQWLPKDAPGKWIEQGPPTHILAMQDQYGTPIEIEVLFLALDTPADVQKLLSMELTGAWINEAREIPKAIIDGLTGRVGRYPSRAMLPPGTQYWSGIIMDTNPPDTDHWWYILAERDVQSEAAQEMLETTVMAERSMRAEGLLAADQSLFKFYRQPNALGPDAENKQNLDPGYYIRQQAGKTKEWINVYIHGNYGYVQDGKPVYTEYNDSIHCQEFEPLFAMPLVIGMDFGLTPAATIGQVDAMGMWRILDEIAVQDMGAERFAALLYKRLTTTWKDLPLECAWGDPAGDQRAGTDERTPLMFMRAGGIKPARPTHTNDFTIRREVVAKKLSTLIDGKPAIMIHPRCQGLRKAMMGAYKYRRMQIVGKELYADKPDKGPFSHVAESLQYMLLGGGEGKAILRTKDRAQPRQSYAETDRPEYNPNSPKTRQRFAITR
jgi:hypothetical protein